MTNKNKQIESINDPRNSVFLGKSYYPEGKTVPIRLFSSPTGNCQLSSLCYVNKLFETNYPEKVLDEILRYSKNLILVDIQKSITVKTCELFKRVGFEVFKSISYVSPTGSKMNIIIFKRV